MRFITIVILVCTFTISFGQKKSKKCNEGCAPQVIFYSVDKDSLSPLSFLRMNQENIIKVSLQGGIENIDHLTFVTSKTAEIRKVADKEGFYMVIPHQVICEIIVDVKTLENYYLIEMVDEGDKKVKQVVKTYPPKTYMVGYERIAVRE